MAAQVNLKLMSVKHQAEKSARQTEQMAHVERREKKRAKKDRKAVDKNDNGDNEAVQIVSNMSKKMVPTNKKRKIQSDELKVVCTDEDTHEYVTSTPSDTPCPERLDFPVKRKGGKKRKKSQNPHYENDAVATPEHADSKPAGDLTKKLQKKKKKKVKQANTAESNTDHDDHATSSSQYRALEYLRTWKSAPDSWTFQKVRQVWLLQHMYDSTKVTSCLIFDVESVLLKHGHQNSYFVFVHDDDFIGMAASWLN